MCRPIRIEPELIDLRTGGEVWEDTNTGFSNIAIGRLVKKLSLNEKLQRLHAAICESVDDLTISMRQRLDRAGTSSNT